MSILNKLSTKAPKGTNKKATKLKTQKLHLKIKELHKTMRAEEKHAMLLVFQGIDASGKDGSIDKLHNGLYSMAVDVHSFKAPTEFERSMDYLWRIHNVVPCKGKIGIFNRSHYEDILYPSVHKTFPDSDIKKRYGHLNDIERLWEETNTHVVKFYLHISKKEQTKRFKERKSSVEKRWKYNSNDLAESKLWNEYMDEYEKIFKKSKIKWIIIPADNKWYRDYLIAKHIYKTMKKLKMKYPTTIN